MGNIRPFGIRHWMPRFPFPERGYFLPMREGGQLHSSMRIFCKQGMSLLSKNSGNPEPCSTEGNAFHTHPSAGHTHVPEHPPAAVRILVVLFLRCFPYSFYSPPLADFWCSKIHFSAAARETELSFNPFPLPIASVPLNAYQSHSPLKLRWVSAWYSPANRV